MFPRYAIGFVHRSGIFSGAVVLVAYDQAATLLHFACTTTRE